MEKQIGQTKDVGFQFGIRKTIPVSTEKVWDILFSDKGLKIWLGDLKNSVELNREYQTKSGIKGFVRVFKPYSHIRMNWRKKNWKNISTIQVRVIGKNNGRSIISFHQEKLTDAEQRLEMKEYWNGKMSKIANEIRKASR